jgi:hypothetical protein
MNVNTLSSLLVLPVVFWSRGIDFSEGSDNLFYCRLAFGVVQVLLFAVTFWIKMKIDAQASSPKSREIIKVKVAKVESCVCVLILSSSDRLH